MTVFLFLVFALGAALAFALWGTEALRDHVISRRRNEFQEDGELAGVPGRWTYGRWHGADEEDATETWVLIHGLSTPSEVYRPLIAALEAPGRRILSYDLWGRGLSNRVEGEHDRAYYRSQLNELLEGQHIAGPVVLVGYSMGGVIAADYAAERPDRVSRVVLLAPAGFKLDRAPKETFAVQTPVLGDALFNLFGGRDLRKDATALPGLPEFPQIIEAETRTKGYLPAVLASLRGLLSEDLTEVHRRISVPVLVIWGEEDTVIPLENMDRMAAANPNHTHVVIEGASHTVAITHADRIAEEIESWITDA